MSRHRRSTLRLVLIMALAAIWTLAAAPGAFAANATNKNVQLPAGKSISGKITKRSTGAALQGASVFATPVSGGVSGESTSTDASGNYTIIALEPGSYRLSISAPFTEPTLLDGFYKTGVSGNLTFDPNAATLVTVGATNVTGRNASLPAGYRISGTVQTSGGTPLAGVSVSAFGTSFGGTSTAADGKFTIQALRAGSYNVQVYPNSSQNYQAGYYRTGVTSHFTTSAAAAADVVITTASVTLLTIKVPAGYKISGTIQSSGGVPQQFASVSAQGPLYRSASTSATGAFTIQGLSNGSYKVYVSPPTDTLQDGYYRSGVASHFTASFSAASAIVISGGNKTTGIIKLPAATNYKITVTVKKSGGALFQDVDVSASGPDFGYDLTGADGKAVMDRLDAGQYYVYVSPPFDMNFQSGYYRTGNTSHFTTSFASRALVTLDSSHTSVSITITIPVGAKISGKITKTGGVAVSGACVSAVSTAGSGSDCTGADGRYEIFALPAGTYKLTVFAPFGVNLQDGYYNATNATHFTTNPGSASGIAVSP